MLISNQPHLLSTQEYINGCGIGTSAPGERDLAAKFTEGSNQYFTSASTDLRTTNTSFTYAFWLNVKILTAGSYFIQHGVIDVNGFLLYTQTTGAVSAQIYQPALATVSKTGFTADAWHHVVFSFDSTANLASISFNGGVPATVACSACSTTNQSPFFGNNAWTPIKDCKMAGIGFWKRILTDQERTSLYNSGNGLTYNNFSDSLKVNLTSYWALNEASGTRNDSHSTNHLTATGSPTSESGVIAISYYNPRTALFDFSTGIYSMGIWNNIIYWTLKSSQNAGRETIAYSQGGLARSHGTIINLPTWGADGITFNGTTQYIDCGLNFNALAGSVGAIGGVVTAMPNPATNIGTIIGSVSGASHYIRANIVASNSSCAFGSPELDTTRASALGYCSAVADGATLKYRVAGVQTGSVAETSPVFGSDFFIARRATQYGENTIAFAFAVKGIDWNLYDLDFYNLYQSTIGQ